MKSIFELENRLDIANEFRKLSIALKNETDAVVYQTEFKSARTGSFMEGINDTVFLRWKYRDTFLSVSEYLTFLRRNSSSLQEEFLLNLEFILNMEELIEHSKDIQLCSVTKVALENIPLILEKMNYKAEKVEDKIIISKRDADVDSVLEFVPENIANVLLEYNDFRNQYDIKEKQRLLKAIDLYIEKNIDIKAFDKELDGSIGTIVNKMGVNHPIKEEPYKLFTDNQLLEWYDKCFTMMLHAIRTVEVKEIKNERKAIVST